MQYKYFSLLCLLSISVMNAMHIKNGLTEIEFNGNKKPILGWIIQCLVNNQEDPFSVTRIVRYKDKTFTVCGDILCLSEDDIAEINSGNAVYCPFYSKEKTRLSRGMYDNVGAIIIGTQDCKAAKQLQFASVGAMINQVKKEKEKRSM